MNKKKIKEGTEVWKVEVFLDGNIISYMDLEDDEPVIDHLFIMGHVIDVIDDEKYYIKWRKGRGYPEEVSREDFFLTKQDANKALIQYLSEIGIECFNTIRTIPVRKAKTMSKLEDAKEKLANRIFRNDGYGKATKRHEIINEYTEAILEEAVERVRKELRVEFENAIKQIREIE